MILNDRIPNDFYKLFRTKNRAHYMELLVSIYEENNNLYSTLGLTEEECKAIMNERIARTHMQWEQEEEDQEEEQDTLLEMGTASAILLKLEKWGWLKKDYDDKMNAYVLSFPEYSQLYAELFKKLQCEDSGQERESILTIYTALYTYHADEDKNNDILKNALRTSKSLGQILSNMQDGMRGYFDELSKQKEFIEIQKVLIDEMNNSDSKKYQILTTTDSFYRYKEAVKELISKILNRNDDERLIFEKKNETIEINSNAYKRNLRELELNKEAMDLVCLIEREFDLIEKKYNRLIEQKTIFASRASARIRYVLHEGAHEEDHSIVLIDLLNRSSKKEEIMSLLMKKTQMSASFTSITDQSFFRRRDRSESSFEPLPMQVDDGTQNSKIEDFVLKPLYTKRELDQFIEQNSKNNVFKATADTVQSMEDLEKLLFVWQEFTSGSGNSHQIDVKEDIKTESGFGFSQLVIRGGEKNV